MDVFSFPKQAPASLGRPSAPLGRSCLSSCEFASRNTAANFSSLSVLKPAVLRSIVATHLHYLSLQCALSQPLPSQPTLSQPSEMNAPLNDDIYVVIMAALVLDSALATAAEMMLLSRRMYHEGGRLLLSGTVELRTSAHVSSFIAFCLAENASRATYVRSLTFTTYTLSAAEASSLAELLPGCTGMNKLSLTRADLFLRHNALSKSFAALRSLEDLTLFKGSTSGDLLATLRSHLRTLTLYEVLVPRRLADVQRFSELSTLKVIYLWLDMLIIQPYIHAFPCLTHLSVTHPARRGRSSKHPFQQAFPSALGSPEDTLNVRRMNQAAQLDGQGWEVLKELDTDPATAWILGLSCRVKRLVLYIPPEKDLGLLPEVLADTCPAVLELTFAGSGFLEHVVTIPSPLDAVVLTLVLGEEHLDTLKRCTDHLTRCFMSSGVRSFRLVICNPDQLGGELRGAHTQSSCLDDVDIKGWARNIQQEIPSLMEVEIEVLGHARAVVSALS